MKFRHILGECDSKEWMSPELEDSDSNTKYRIVISLLNMEEITGEKKYHVGASIIIPDISRNALTSASEYLSDLKDDGEHEAAILWEYGCRADVWGATGEKPLELMLLAFKKAIEISANFEDYMSKSLNQLGWDGWEYIHRSNH
jgi:hypothetical protein